VRFLCESKVVQLSWREIRAYMLVDKLNFERNDPDGTRGHPDFGTLMLSGYLRGSALNPNNIVHITGYGDAQIAKIESEIDPYAVSRSRKKKPISMSMDSTTSGDIGYTGGGEPLNKEISMPSPSEQETLFRENIPDVFAAEQTWPTPEELEAAEKEHQFRKKKSSVWIFGVSSGVDRRR